MRKIKLTAHFIKETDGTNTLWNSRFLNIKKKKEKKTQVCFCSNGGKLSKKKYIKSIVLQYPP